MTRRTSLINDYLYRHRIRDGARDSRTAGRAVVVAAAANTTVAEDGAGRIDRVGRRRLRSIRDFQQLELVQRQDRNGRGLAPIDGRNSGAAAGQGPERYERVAAAGPLLQRTGGAGARGDTLGHSRL